jgi:uncharacterized protein (TIGR00369 family)
MDTDDRPADADAGGGACSGPSIEELVVKARLHAMLGVRVVEITPERVVLSLPVNETVHQPHGLLHGGVSALLAESAASIGAAVSVPAGRQVVGIELNASHLRSMRTGTLVATATPVRKGRTVHVWRVGLTDESGRAVCEARCTLAVTDAPDAAPPVAPPPDLT